MLSRTSYVTKSLGRVLLLAALAAGVAGCSAGVGELETYISEVKSRPAPPLDPPPVLEKFESFTYEAHGLRDPFSRPNDGAESSAASGPRPDPNRRKEPLESFPLESLKYVGVLMRKNTAFAIIQADASLYQVRAGNYMGQNFGVVTRVTEEQVLLKELVQDAAGDWVERESTLQLQAQEVKK